jgi:hypothetical protein
MKRDFLSAHREPALGGGPMAHDPAEFRAEPVNRPAAEIDAIRDAVANEPHLAHAATAGAPPAFHIWLDDRRQRCRLFGNLGVTLLAALVGGPFAIAGAFITGRQGLFAGIYVVLFGPVVEELLKQSGMVYLLERRPYRIFAAWQFVVAAALSALIFATVENLMYIHLYADEALIDMPSFAQFRWKVCTALHVCCSVIASLGLVRVWKHQRAHGVPADLSRAFPLFVAAIAVHGIYNLCAVFLGEIFTITP